VYTALFYPHGGAPRPNPLVLLHFLPYVLKQTLGALFPAGRVALMIPAPCPARYHRVPIACAWRRAWQWAAFVEIEAVQDLR
jgi:hypothetical protein